MAWLCLAELWYCQTRQLASREIIDARLQGLVITELPFFLQEWMKHRQIGVLGWNKPS